MKRIRQAGFSVVEGILVLLVIAGLAGVGYIAINRSSNKTADSNATTPTATQETAKESEAPQIEQTSDLTKASDTLDSAVLDTSDTELDAELNKF